MPTISRPLRKRLALAATAVLATGLGVVSTPAPANAATFQPALQCPPEQTPAAGAPRSAPYTPYQVPFNAELGVAASSTGGSEGGYIVVNGSNGNPGGGSNTGGALSVVLGPKGTFGGVTYTTGTLFGNACGYFSIPSLLGNIPQGGPAPDPGNALYNHNFILHGPPFITTQSVLANPNGTAPDGESIQSVLAKPIPVALEVPGTGVPMVLLSGTGSSDSNIANAIATTPAGNGGLNVSFDTSAKSTATLSLSTLAGLLPSLPTGLVSQSLLTSLQGLSSSAGGSGPTECTLTIGNQQLTGYPPANVGPLTQPVHVSTNPADFANSAQARGVGATPVTGPINNATGIAVSTGIIQPPVDPGTTPDVAAPGVGTPPTTLCNPSVASLLNTSFGLAQAGTQQGTVADTFVAPVTFEAYASR
jgi:hypothetical protein